jgi:hypothetical protein
MQFCDNQQIVTFFCDKLFIRITQLTTTHGKTTIVNMIRQMFCNYNLNGIVIKKEIDQKIITKLPSNFC